MEDCALPNIVGNTYHIALFKVLLSLQIPSVHALMVLGEPVGGITHLRKPAEPAAF